MENIDRWRGVPIEDLTHDELLEAFRQLASMHSKTTTPEATRDRAAGRAKRFMSRLSQ